MPSVIPPRAEIRSALASLRVHMQPVGPQQIRDCLGRLAVTTRHQSASDAEWRGRAAEYARLLGHYPADIWADACDEHARESTWFPTIHELNERMLARLGRRKRAIERLERMLEHETSRSEGREDRGTRLRAIVRVYQENMGSRSTVVAMLRRSAVRAEIELAEMEGREPAEWAREEAA